MIRYYGPADAWITGRNLDDQGLPSKDLTGDPDICGCEECKHAQAEKLGTNFDQLPK